MGIRSKKYIEIIPDRWYIYSIMKHLNEQIKQLRKKSGLTQVEFSKRSGVGLRFLRELEQGKATVRLDKVNKVLDFLGYHLELKRNESELL